jgi:hypothetical protein
MQKLRRNTRKYKGGFFGSQNLNKTWYQNNLDWETWNKSNPSMYPRYDKTIYYYKKGSTNYGKIPELAIRLIPDPNADWKESTNYGKIPDLNTDSPIQGKLEILDKKQILESNYPQQISLPVENVLPPMESGIDSPITQRKIVFEQTPIRSAIQQRLNHFWTNDANILTTATNPHTACNSFATPNGPSQDGLMYPNKTYMCIREKMFYFIDERIVSLSNFNFTLKTPTYSRTPYKFIHFGTFFGRKMNLFKMMVSTHLFELLQSKNKEWLNRIPLSISTSFTLERKFMYSANLGQLITPALESSLKGYNINDDEFKIQICAKDEYIYWIVETLLLNFQKLVDIGLKRFKYTFLVGEYNVFSITEFFPNMNTRMPIEQHTYKDIKFKTELLNAPNIVLYTRNQDNYTELMHMLCELFPNDFFLSKGISRFNMRINDNITFSVGGHNEDKFTKISDIIPAEYKLIVNEVKRNPERCEELTSYSKIVTGHTLLNEDCTVNKILSYNNIVSPFSSFKAIYTKYGLMEYYISLSPDLDIQIPTMEITDSDIDLYRDIPVPLTAILPNEEISVQLPSPSGGKLYRKTYKRLKRINKK